MKLLSSCWRAFARVRTESGYKTAFRLVPVAFVLIRAVVGFARYHARVHQQDLDGTHRGREATALTEALDEEYRILGRWLRESLHNLGPTFIKIGQMLSTRADLIPLPAMLELSALQENVARYPTGIAREIIRRELGSYPEALWARFDPEPMAAASLSQAYRAVLSDGRDVVVKVQRPCLPEIIERDIKILTAIAHEISRYPSLCRHADWPGVVLEFHRTILEEIDYIREGRNADRFRHNFRDNQRIYIPRIIWRLTGRRVLTIEYVPGVRVTDVETMEAMGIDRKQITAHGATFYLKQLLEDGLFHADPHPGNVRIMPDGRVGFFDFGMVGHISHSLKQHLVDAFLHVVGKEYRALIDDFQHMGFLTDKVDKDALVADLSPIIEARFAEGLTKVQFRKLLLDFSDVVYDHQFRLPTEFTFIMRALLTLEGVALTINPEFNFIDVALPYAQKLVLLTEGSSIRSALLKEIFSKGRFNAHAAINLFKVAAGLSGSARELTPSSAQYPEN